MDKFNNRKYVGLKTIYFLNNQPFIECGKWETEVAYALCKILANNPDIKFKDEEGNEFCLSNDKDNKYYWRNFIRKYKSNEKY